MSGWWTYGLQDLLLFSPRVYRRMFELHNAAVLALQLPSCSSARPSSQGRPAACVVGPGRLGRTCGGMDLGRLELPLESVCRDQLGSRLCCAGFRPRGAAGRLVRHGPGRLRFAARRSVPSVAGLALFLYALVLHPLVPKLSGRPFQSAELFGIAPDPTAIATLGLVSMASTGSAAWLLLAVPLAWCAASGATLHAMGAPEAGIPLTAAGLAVASGLWSSAGGRASPTR